ncbi:MAG: hypothetical protein K6G91_09700 [Kiritimatiellae bacterium]|nr:hypothetical protein [Kiritimatiellia bacterium]
MNSSVNAFGSAAVVVALAVVSPCLAQESVPTSNTETTPHLVYHCSLDSADAVANPLVGQPGGDCTGATFVEGKKGKAMYVQVDQLAATMPVPNGLPVESGCIEYWAKIDTTRATFTTSGNPAFFRIANPSNWGPTAIIEFNSNDGNGNGGLIGLLPTFRLAPYSYSNDGASRYSAFFSEGTQTNWHHYALVWNVNGISTVVGNPAAALLLDGKVVCKMSKPSDWDEAKFVNAMSKATVIQMPETRTSMYSRVPYAIDEFRIWDTDVTNGYEIDVSGNPDNPPAPTPNPTTTPQLVYRSTLDSADAVANPLVGQPGDCTGATFVEGKKGNAMYVPANTLTATIPLPNGLPVERGCIEYWAKINTTQTTFTTSGNPAFFRIANATNWYPSVIVEFNSNDGAGNGGLIGLLPTFRLAPYSYRDAEARSYSSFFPEGTQTNWHHYALVWNTNGISTVVGNPAAALLLDGNVVCKMSKPADWDNAKFARTMSQELVLQMPETRTSPYSRVPYAIDEFRIWDSDVTNGYEIDEPEEPTPPTSQLVYHSTLDSADAVANPVVGQTGDCTGATFVEGKKGNAMYVPANTLTATIPLPNGLPVESGCIEYWAKIDTTKTTFITSGNPAFFRIANATNSYPSVIVEFNSNDGAGNGGLIGLLPTFRLAPYSYRDAEARSYSSFFPEGTQTNWHHYALVWNTNGITTVEGNPAAALLLDGNVVCKMAKPSDWDEAKFVNAMAKATILQIPEARISPYSRVPFAIDELRIWNSDVTNGYAIENPSEPRSISFSDVTATYDGAAHTIGEIEGETNGVTVTFSDARDGVYSSEKPTISDVGSMTVWYRGEMGSNVVAVGSAVVKILPRKITLTSADLSKDYDGTPLVCEAAPAVTGDGFADGEGVAYEFTGSQTVLGSSENAFTWSAADGTKAGNYDVTTVFGTLTVNAPADGTAFEVATNATTGAQSVVVTHVNAPAGGAVALPTEVCGLPVERIAAGALDGVEVTSLYVPGGVSVEGGVQGLASVTNITFAADARLMSVRGCPELREVVMPGGDWRLEPWSFLGCWNLERVVFRGDPPFGEDDAGAADLVKESVRPATLLMMADAIFYPEANAKKWQKALSNLGYGGRSGGYAGEWAGVEPAPEPLPEPEPEPAPVAPSAVTTIVEKVAAPYALTDSVEDRAIASVQVDCDCAIDEFVLKDGVVFDAVIYIENVADDEVTLTLPTGYEYRAFKGAKPLTIPAKSQHILTITRVADRTFLVSREELEAVE